MSLLGSWRKRRQAKRLLEEALRDGSLRERIAKLDVAQRLFDESGHLRGQAEVLYRLGQFRDKLGEKESALVCFRRAHALAERVGDRALANAIQGDLKSPYVARGGTDWEAEPMRRPARWEQTGQWLPDADRLSKEGFQFDLPEGFLKLIVDLHRQVVQLHHQGQYERAVGIAEQACSLARQHLGEAHPEVATSLNNLAVLHEAMGDYAAAEPLHRQALEIRRAALGDAHPDVATSLNNLAVVCVPMQRASESLTLMALAAAISDRIVGEVFSLGSENQRMVYLSKVQVESDLFLSLEARPKSPLPGGGAERVA